MKRPDYSEWLTPERLAVEEKAWTESPHERHQADLVAGVCREHGVQTIVEFGCGTGWVPFFLGDCTDLDVQYIGVDANGGCLHLAREKNPARLFVKSDVRHATVPQSDLAVSFAFLKHFHLSEWDAVLTRILSFGRFAVFSATVGTTDREDDCEFPHVWVSRERLERVVHSAGHEIIGTPWSNQPDTEWMVVTRRVD